MTDLDAIKRTLADLEKRVIRLERLADKPAVDVVGEAVYRRTLAEIAAREGKQWCRCGRDVCRYPACSSKVASVDDPLGR